MAKINPKKNRQNARKALQSFNETLYIPLHYDFYSHYDKPEEHPFIYTPVLIDKRHIEGWRKTQKDVLSYIKLTLKNGKLVESKMIAK